MNSDDSHCPRHGKAAPFPLAICPELHERLATGERRQRLVKWLNSVPDAGGIPAPIAGGRAQRHHRKRWGKRPTPKGGSHGSIQAD
ncbi:MAG: hypothetical protein ABJF10_10045 [Chthoniobacter sp.]|uniref:hypothetical protein n=1 Tax=Chthoniobacter sp. TaxID=2510640 RepID=UPI0032A9DCA5